MITRHAMVGFVALVVLGLFSESAAAQIKATTDQGETVWVDATPEATGQTATSTQGTQINISNRFSVDVIITIKDSSGMIVSTFTLPDTSTLGSINALSLGKYDVCVRPAGTPPEEDEMVGCLESLRSPD